MNKTFYQQPVKWLMQEAPNYHPPTSYTSAVLPTQREWGHTNECTTAVLPTQTGVNTHKRCVKLTWQAENFTKKKDKDLERIFEETGMSNLRTGKIKRKFF
jgi:hypothetical protein